MGDLEAKLLYCDTVGYCSSSDEDVKDDKRIDSTLQQTYHHHDEATGTKQLVPRNYRNTGPKGVLEDYKICKEQLEEEEMKRYEQIIAQAKMCTLSGESENDNLEEIRRKRLLEMKDRLYAIRKVDELTEKEQFLNYIESNRDRWVLIHIYDEDNEGCITLNKIFNTLSIRYPYLRLAKVLPLTIGMSPQFKMKALPALQVYRDELLVGNFIRITDQLGEKFTMDQLIRFLSENEIELEISKYPSNIEESYGDEDTTGVDDGY
ncbi:phosducin family protein [Loa loa]|uniref:Phosducin family protein n=1 Tax=Loa loa TaxID=7209 RepID=A0A1S0U1C5_LOALO|nr:phosducin family protein [Loa loa]EFO23562.1 phosducin family protein [Loa loa]